MWVSIIFLVFLIPKKIILGEGPRFIMEETLKLINRLEKIRLIKRYAIGGGVAALFYTEPILTHDLDIFCLLPEEKRESELITLSPLYEYLKREGYKLERERVVIEGIPVQFIPAYNELIEEAVKRARRIKYGHVETRVLPVEYLIAISLETNRPKDRERILLFFEQSKVDKTLLRDILKRHGLQDMWKTFRRRYEE